MNPSSSYIAFSYILFDFDLILVIKSLGVAINAEWLIVFIFMFILCAKAPTDAFLVK